MFTPCSLTPSFNLNIYFDRDMFSNFLMSAQSRPQASEKFRYKNNKKKRARETKKENVYITSFHSPIKNWNLRHLRNSFESSRTC
jgi:hypothetical protein